MSTNQHLLDGAALCRLLSITDLTDLTDPINGPHAIQVLLGRIVDRLGEV